MAVIQSKLMIVLLLGYLIVIYPLLRSENHSEFHDFCITQILREIKFGDSRSSKSAII